MVIKSQRLMGAAAVVFAAAMQSISLGHYIWIVSDAQGTRIVFGDGLAPDRAEFLTGIEAMRVWQWRDHAFARLEIDKATDGEVGWFVGRGATGFNAKELECAYGVFRRGDHAMFLNYSAKFIHLNNTWSPQPSGNLALDIVPKIVDGQVQLTAFYRNRPLADCDIEFWSEHREPQRLHTNESGQVVLPVTDDQHLLVRAKWVEPEAGAHEGVDFAERRYYCTLVLSGLPLATTTAAVSLPDLPEGLTSFGAAVSDGELYVFGGQRGDAHHYAHAWQNGQLLALQLQRPTEWRVVHEGRGLQGLGMVSHRGRLFRVGGFEARNEIGDEHDLHSLDEFAVYERANGSWRRLTPLPEPRSSFDAAIVGDRLFIVGGWTLAGAKAPVWLETAWSFDLTSLEGSWQSVPAPPFQRRALALAAVGDRLYAIGGMESNGQVTRRVAWLDVNQGAWHDGPELPEAGRMEGFGSAAASVGDRLVVSAYSGQVYVLSTEGDAWERVHRLKPGRFFHRLVTVGDNQVIVVGGANMEEGKILETETIKFPGAASQ